MVQLQQGWCHEKGRLLLVDEGISEVEAENMMVMNLLHLGGASVLSSQSEAKVDRTLKQIGETENNVTAMYNVSMPPVPVHFVMSSVTVFSSASLVQQEDTRIS